MSNQRRNEQLIGLEPLERHQNAEKSDLEEGIQLLELARNAQRLFAKQEPREKRRLLSFPGSTSQSNKGEFNAVFRQSLEMFTEIETAATHVEAGENAKLAKSEIWLGDLDSNQD